MAKRIFYIADEMEWLGIKNTLKSHRIPFEERRKSDAAFPHLTMDDPFEIIILEDQTEMFFEVVGKKYHSKVVDTEVESTSRLRLFHILLVIYALIMTVLFLKYFHIYRKSGYEKNFKSEWSYDNKSLFTRYRKNDEIISVYSDRNFDANFEKVENFKNGKSILIMLDQNEDGIFEEEKHYSLSGEFTGSSLDLDNDGLIDKSTLILENGDTLNFEDKNKNGIFELVK